MLKINKSVKSRLVIIISFLLFVFSTSSQSQNPIIGYWQWSYNPNIGMTEDSEIIFHVYQKGEELVGDAFSIRNGKKEPLNHLRIKSVKQNSGLYTLELPWANHYYQGTIQGDQQSIVGFLKHHSQRDDLKLIRVDGKFGE